jgi:hypothetical protein
MKMSDPLSVVRVDMRKIFVSVLAAVAVATFSLVPMASVWADCGSGAHAARTASTTIDTTTTAPQTPVERPKSGG